MSLFKTPLNEIHIESGARMVPFAGWDMPVQYSGIIDEVKAVRTNCGLFDVSHMGRLDIHGTYASDFLNRILSVDVIKLRPNRARYGVICNDSGGIIDDCIVYKFDLDHFLLVPNASNKKSVIDWLNHHMPNTGVTVTDITDRQAMIALQGPKAIATLNNHVANDISALKMFNFTQELVDGVDVMIARTGYTGEDGVELFAPKSKAPQIWETFVQNGAKPCGLGSRDLLRLEAGLLLHGNDMDITINPFEAGLDRFVYCDKDDYLAGSALRKIRSEGPIKKLLGLYIIGNRVARSGYPLMHENRQVGHITSGTYSPTLDRNIALGYLQTDLIDNHKGLKCDIRGQLADVEVTALPFYSRNT
jgi:aminomethyltransferase